eukprot:CAMPEP_0198295902 /NCGR_PEP_ID=MMETSP1449-20131203/30185_1 /TAXON_ID=420275 /ORGANISM="Attheya septentrionalis, Strain CCMP2084" /LENGTH=375 /DNA_ID=CAMNT_0043996337 /DNA_START=111 /DNA_END=1238 /DNA_ORIENTATION=+
MTDGKGRLSCTWAKAIMFLLLTITGVILIWMFAPIGKGLSRIIPDFADNETSSVSVPTQTPSIGSGEQNVLLVGPTYEFNTCNIDGGGRCCNGLDNICDLRVNEIMLATVHNAMSHGQEKFLGQVLNNNYRPLEDALEAGFRGLTLDLCICNGIFQFCHGTCSGSRDAEEVLSSIEQFLRTNPSEVLMLIFQINSNVLTGSPTLTDLETAVQKVGLGDYIYAHPNVDTEWPTLGTLVENNNRLLIFHHEGPTCTNPGDCPDGFHYYFQYAMDTSFTFESISEINNSTLFCSITRGGGGKRQFLGINLFINPPNPDAAEVTSEKEYVGSRISECSSIRKKNPNMLIVDFWSLGDLPEVTQNHNRALGTTLRRNSLR